MKNQEFKITLANETQTTGTTFSEALKNLSPEERVALMKGRKPENKKPVIDQSSQYEELLMNVLRGRQEIIKLKTKAKEIEEALKISYKNDEENYKNEQNLKTKNKSKEPVKDTLDKTKEDKKDMEQLTSAQIKMEIEKIIKGDFSLSLKEKGLEYTGLDISNTKTGFHILANFKGNLLSGRPKFIADIVTNNGKIEITNHKLEANALVSAFAPQDKINEMAANLGEDIKKYLEKDRKKAIERIDIENNILKITYK